jgi:hypothetical protein
MWSVTVWGALSPCGAPPQGGSFYADDNLGSAWIEAAEVATITPETAIGWEENDEDVRNDNWQPSPSIIVRPGAAAPGSSQQHDHGSTGR